MQMLKKLDDNIPGSPVVLNSQTGLIGMPTLEIGGLWARCLINPAIRVGGQIRSTRLRSTRLKSDRGEPASPRLDLSERRGGWDYTVFQIDYDADTRGLPWYKDLHCQRPGEPPTPAFMSFFPQAS